MILNPNKIYQQYLNNELDHQSTVSTLLSIAENSKLDQYRSKAIEIIKKLNISDLKIFLFLENLMISDSSEDVRIAAALYIGDFFLDEAIKPILWAYKYETSYDCRVILIRLLAKIQNDQSKKVLMESLNKILKSKRIWDEKNYIEIKFKTVIKKLRKIKKSNFSNQNEIAEILINYLTIKKLAESYPNIYFELDADNSLIEELDLSDYLEFEVKGMPWGWKNNIKSIIEIPGLNNLNNLKRLNISNNQIKDLTGITEITSLTHLILSL